MAAGGIMQSWTTIYASKDSDDSKWFPTELVTYTAVEAVTMSGFSPTLIFEVELPASVNTKYYNFDV